MLKITKFGVGIFCFWCYKNDGVPFWAERKVLGRSAQILGPIVKVYGNNGSKTARAFLRLFLVGCLEHFFMLVCNCMHVCVLCVSALHPPCMLRFVIGWRWGWVGRGHVHVHVKLHTPWMLRCSISCEVAHAMDATLWYRVGLGLGGVGGLFTFM